MSENSINLISNEFQSFDLPAAIGPGFRKADSTELRAITVLIEDLGTKIFDELKAAHSGAFISVHIPPSFDNLGAVARIFVTRKEKLKEASLQTANGGYQLALDENIFKRQILAPAVQRGRNGAAPQQIPLRLNLDDQLLCGIMTLYIGIKKEAQAQRRTS